MKVISIQSRAISINAVGAADTFVEPARYPWRFSTLLQAPHRMGFAAGALILAITALWWACALWLRGAGISVPWAVPPAIAHSVVMCFGFMPLFFVGFLFTAGPKWLDLPPVSADELARPIAAYVIAWLIYMVAVHLDRLAAAAAVAVAAGAWTLITWKFGRMVQRSKAADRLHAIAVFVGIALGSVSLWIVAAALAVDMFTVARIAVLAGVWGCMATVYVVVAHRMIPFFTANEIPALNAWRPMWLLWVFIGTIGLEFVFATFDLLFWPLPGYVRAIQAGAEAIIAIGLLTLAIKWGLMQSLRVRLLAMLHVGFVWLGIAIALQAASHTMMLMTDDRMSLGLASLHALTMGFMGATLFAMATRVSAGHSGRRLVVDEVTWWLFWTQQAATALRLVAAAWLALPFWLTPLAATLWATASVLWAVRYGGWYGRPREDGKPG
jgi:uncharacterized protein involved in response to NO